MRGSLNGSIFFLFASTACAQWQGGGQTIDTEQVTVYPPGFLERAQFAARIRIHDPEVAPCTRPVCVQGHAIPFEVVEPLMGESTVRTLVMGGEVWPDALRALHVYMVGQPADAILVASPSTWEDPETHVMEDVLDWSAFQGTTWELHRLSFLDDDGVRMFSEHCMVGGLGRFPDGGTTSVDGHTLKEEMRNPSICNVATQRALDEIAAEVARRAAR
jgi:hypothetical protein